MNQAHNGDGHSSTVELSLLLATATVPLAKIGPDRITLREAYEAPPGPATVFMRVDGREDRWSVLLPEGLTADRRTGRVENVTLQSLQ